MGKEIWIPKAETHVQIEDGKVRVWENMILRPQPVAKPPSGFASEQK